MNISVRREGMLRLFSKMNEILDVGCGEGIWVKGLLDNGAIEVVGIEATSRCM